MKKINNDQKSISPDHTIDITGLICPMTFVRTKLLLEKIAPGDVLEVRLKGEEPLTNVPRSARQHGHTILSLTPETPDQAPAGIHRLLIRKEDA
ncbi:sulfurtransferase TusA family protein [Thalassospiraceae bacterium LMO-JJ14]|nr:sulfurtransferase TusA family protein [Thalassospiraceae bacterium LMO-JJ14]